MENRVWRGVQALTAATLFFGLPAAAQEKSSARDMFFGGLEAAAPAPSRDKPPAPKPAVPKPAASRPAPTAAKNRPAPDQRTKPSVPVMNAVQSPLGLRYALLKINGIEGVEVAPSTHFRSGDRIQLRVQANADGFLYIVSQGSSGAWQVLFPSKGRNEGSNRVKAGEDYHTSVFRFDSKPGVEKLFVVLSRMPEKDLDSVIYDLKGNSQKEPTMLASNLSVNDPLVAKLRNSYTRDMILEESNAPDSSERAMYVVNKSTGPDARVVADIKLIHE
jgi:hypothetical protein